MVNYQIEFTAGSCEGPMQVNGTFLSRLGTQETRVTQVSSKNRISVRYLFFINKVPKSSEDPKHKVQVIQKWQKHENSVQQSKRAKTQSK